MLPLGRDELLGSGLAHGLGQALAGDGVFGGEDAVVYRLAARHVEARGARAGANSSSCSFDLPDATSGVAVGGSAIRVLLGPFLPPLPLSAG